MHRRPLPFWRPAAAVLAAGGLALGGTVYAASYVPSPTATADDAPEMADVAPPVAPEATPPATSEASVDVPPEVMPDSAGPVLEGPAPEPIDPPAIPAVRAPMVVARQLIGEVTAITPDPAAFTVRTPAGEEVTYRVLEVSVFKAGYDRPYNVGLLKIGDGVNVIGGPLGQGPGAGQPKPGQPRLGQPKPAPAGRPDQTDARPVAQQVVVRPAGEPPRGMPGVGGRPGPDEKGASDAPIR